jgi:hypothetical protein
LHSHLVYEGGINDVAYCIRVPLEVQRLFAANEGRIIPSYPEDIPSIPPQEQDSQEDEFETNNSQSTNTSEAMGREPVLRPPRSASMGLGVVHRTPQELRQLSMTKGFNASTKLHLDRAWASAFNEANIPFNVIRHPAFIYAVKERAKHRMPAYTPPSYNAIRTSLLKAKKEEVERKTTTQLGDLLHKYGVTLCADGWDNVQNRPLLNIIQTSTCGDLFLGTIDTTGEHKPPFHLELDLAEQALENFHDRWRLMKTDLHWAGAILNPMLCGWRSLHDLPESRTILNRVLQKMTPDYDTFLQVLAEYQDFLENRAPFEGSIDPRRHDAPLHEWWDAMGSGTKAFQTITRRILGQVCSASACERNWNMYSFVHNMVRNHLKHNRADDLVYVYTNTRLIRHRRGPRIAQWYGLNQVH